MLPGWPSPRQQVPHRAEAGRSNVRLVHALPDGKIPAASCPFIYFHRLNAKPTLNRVHFGGEDKNDIDATGKHGFGT